MKLNLKRPLVVFDLETTGLDLVNDRIIQISYIKIHPDGREERKDLLVNPGKSIPVEVVQLTGITNEQVAQAPTFKELAADLAAAFRGCDFAGFNSITSMCPSWPKNSCVQKSTSTSPPAGSSTP